MQKQKTKEEAPKIRESDVLQKIADQPLTRPVTLKYESCCGCGCSTEKILRHVPYDSPLKDGDEVKNFEDTDKYLGAW